MSNAQENLEVDGIDMNLSSLMLKIKGGSGSGNFGHSGRPGKKGGSASSSLSSKAVFMDEGIEYPIGEKYAKLIDEFAEAHPKEALDGINKVVVVGGYEGLQDLTYKLGYDMEEIEKMGSAGGAHFSKEGIIAFTTTFVAKEDMRHTFDHEVGHNVYQKAQESFGGGVDGWGVYYDSKSNFGRPSKYANTNAEEGFCETYPKYLRDKSSLSRDEVNRVEYILEDIGVTD